MNQPPSIPSSDKNNEPFYYPIGSSQPRYTREQQWEILNSHPFFTGRCLQCEMPFPPDYQPNPDWECPQPGCGWKYILPAQI